MKTFARIPKIELHVHLEGAIPHAALWEMVQKYGGDPETHTLGDMVKRFKYHDFPQFIRTWIWKNRFLREYEDFTFIAEAVARDMASQNIRYAEVFFSPADFARQGLTPQRLVEAIRLGLACVNEIEISLVADLVRDFGPERAAVTLAQINEVREQGVIGITIGGSEQDFPPEPFAPVYAEARKLGFHTSAHAGEAAGANSIWGAIHSLGVERIGHGTRATEDPALIDYLAEYRIPLEMCPLSNLRTGIVHSVKDHPIREFFERGLLVTVNSDDPQMFGNCLSGEYQLLVDSLGFTPEDIHTLILNGIQASWLPENRKKDLAASFQMDPNWNLQGDARLI
jgi:adenosine deaminase